MMKSSELVAKVVDIAKHYKTLYVMGCFGAPLTDTNKSRYIKNHPYNMAAARTSMIMAAVQRRQTLWPLRRKNRP